MKLFFQCCLFTILCSQSLAAKTTVDTAQRIIALSPHAVEMLFAIGAGDRIVATIEYADYPAAALTIPRIGNFTGLQIEKIVQLQPDLIIAWKSGNKSTDLQKLQSLGLKLFYSHPKNIDEISSELIQLGMMTGLQEKAQQVADDLDAKYQQIKNRYKDKKYIRVFYQLWHDPLRTVGPGNWSQSLIDDCKGSNIFADAGTLYPMVSLEKVLAKDPQIIILPFDSNSEDANTKFWKKWQQISAVKNNHLITINPDLLHRFGPRAIEGLKLLCQAIDSVREE